MIRNILGQEKGKKGNSNSVQYKCWWYGLNDFLTLTGNFKGRQKSSKINDQSRSVGGGGPSKMWYILPHIFCSPHSQHFYFVIDTRLIYAFAWTKNFFFKFFDIFLYWDFHMLVHYYWELCLAGTRTRSAVQYAAGPLIFLRILKIQTYCSPKMLLKNTVKAQNAKILSR